MQSSDPLRGKTVPYLAAILLLAAILRVPFLQNIPMGLNCDEALNGYEAYSMLETLRDRYGNFLPLFTRAFGGHRPTLYIFVTIPFIKVLGLNETATRLPSALSGVLTVLVVYLIATQLFNSKTGLISALLLAVNPWHIHFSRSAYEAGLLPLLFCLGFLFLIKSKTNPYYLIASALSFGLSLNTYQAARVFVPLFMMGAIPLFWKQLLVYWRQTLLAIIAFAAIFIPLLRFWISPSGMARANQVGIDLNGVQLLQNYLSFFNPEYLFFEGSSDITFNPAAVGCLYYFEIITTIIGVAWILGKGNREQKLLLLWLALYPIPAALVDTASPLRTFGSSPVFALLSGWGFVRLDQLIRLQSKQLFWITSSTLILSSCAIFAALYFLNYPPEAARLWKYGMQEAIAYAEQSSYRCIVISSDRNSSCFALHDFLADVPFYTQYSPEAYQQSPIQPFLRGFREKIYTLGKYQLISIVNQTDLKPGCLWIVRPDEMPTLTARGYSWKEVRSIQDTRGLDYLKLIEIVKP